jgi:tRNA-splicing ligase RtcB (3'-phosphate/5'-hydroxy nucleic acid ligase)
MRVNVIRPETKGHHSHSHFHSHAPRVFDSSMLPADPDVLAQLEDGVRDADLAAPPVVLPDFHHKHDMEMPSSIAVATRDTIRPTLTSASVNCGMALVAFDLERPGPRAIDAFYRAVRERFPYPTTHRRDLSAKDVLRCAAEGAHFAVDRFGIAEAELERIEEGGRLDIERFGGVARLQRAIPLMSVQLSRMRFGTVGPSNHFIELQQVEEVLDPVVAARLGVREGQVTLQYHNGGGVLAGQVGRLFGRRKKMATKVRLEMAVQKPLYHFASARSLRQLQERMRLYFSGGCPPVARSTDEGSRLMLANAAAMNYGFAFRMATYAVLRRLADEIFGATGSQLVVDSPHNSIYEEDVDGERALVHRHNSCRAYPAGRMASGTAFGEVGQAILLPGTNRTSSYLCVAGDDAAKSLYSACHGAGTVIDELEKQGVSSAHPGGHRTQCFSYSDAAPREVAHLDDRGVDEAVGILAGPGIVRPVARMRPFAVLR